MGCGSSVNGVEKGESELRANQTQIHERRLEIDKKDEQIQRETERLVRNVSELGQEASEREQLGIEMAAAAEAHSLDLQMQRDRLRAEHQDALQQKITFEEDEARQRLEEVQSGEEFTEAFREEVEHAEQKCSEVVRIEEHRSASAHEKLMTLRAEVRHLQQERDSAEEAATVTREAFLAERRAARRQDEVILAEVRSQASETEALSDSSRAMEARNRSLQLELSEVSFTIGQRHYELTIKDSELNAVRQNVNCVEGELDELNKQLLEQCMCVERVEGSLRCSRDLGEKVRALRAMLNESHSTLGQLCGALEQECLRREQCTQDLKQQRARTELLMHLLQRFKSRTQYLAPRALLNSHEAVGVALTRNELSHVDETLSAINEPIAAVPG